MSTHISRSNSNKLKNPIMTSSSPTPSTSETTPHDISPAILSLSSVPATLLPAPGIDSTFLIPSTVKTKIRMRTAMVIAGREALLEADREDKIGSGNGEGKEEEDEREGGGGRDRVAALAPDKRGEVQTRFLQLRLKRLRVEAEVTEEEKGKSPVKRRRSLRVEVKEGEKNGEDISVSRDPMDLATRTAKLEESMAGEKEEGWEETLEKVMWVRKRLAPKVRERERLLGWFGRGGM